MSLACCSSFTSDHDRAKEEEKAGLVTTASLHIWAAFPYPISGLREWGMGSSENWVGFLRDDFFFSPWKCKPWKELYGWDRRSYKTDSWFATNLNCDRLWAGCSQFSDSIAVLQVRGTFIFRTLQVIVEFILGHAVITAVQSNCAVWTRLLTWPSLAPMQPGQSD